MEEELGDLMIDYNEENLKLRKANTSVGTAGAETNQPSSKGSFNKPNNKMIGFGFGRMGVKPLNQKKVEATQIEGAKKKSDIGPVASGMQKFMRQDSGTNETKAPKAKSSVPMLFRKRLAK